MIDSKLTEKSSKTCVFDLGSSRVKPVLCGVPQGSILGPLLFSLYINDITHCCNADFKLFADDTAVIISHPNLDMLSISANDAIDKISKWLIMNKLSLNIEKTMYMFFHVNKRCHDWHPTLKLGHSQLNYSKCTKYLGFYIDENLSFKPHISQLTAKLRKWVGIFHKIGPLLNLSTKYIIYYSFFQSSLLYGVEVYGTAAKTYLAPLIVIQHKALKALFGYHWKFPSSKLFECTHIQSLDILFNIRTMLMLWKFIHLPSRLNVEHLFNDAIKVNTHNYSLRDQLNINLNFQRASFTTSTLFQHFLMWNKIPPNFKCINYLKHFKSKIIQHIDKK